MPNIDYRAAEELLENQFDDVESAALEGKAQPIGRQLIKHFDRIFLSKTQAYREVLIGCVLARLQDKSIDIHKPYINQGADAYNGRTLDEKVVNPTLQERKVPCSKGPFLSAFRRSVTFTKKTRDGLRDKESFDSLLALVDYVATVKPDPSLLEFFRYLIYRFISLRQESDISISHLSRISLEQYDNLIASLLATPSGGRFPVFLVEAAFNAIKLVFNLAWEITCLEINVADGSKGAGGDITLKRENSILMAIEITERTIDRSRVVSTFNTKIAPHAIEDYLFFIKPSAVKPDALLQTRQYFSQGHEVNFLEIKNWILMILATLGHKGRAIFSQFLVQRLSSPGTPAAIKLAWNNAIAAITSV